MSRIVSPGEIHSALPGQTDGQMGWAAASEKGMYAPVLGRQEGRELSCVCAPAVCCLPSAPNNLCAQVASLG